MKSFKEYNSFKNYNSWLKYNSIFIKNEVDDEKKPNVKPFTFYWITDSHLDETKNEKERLQWVIDEANSNEPDMLIHTGDFVEGKRTFGNEESDFNNFFAVWNQLKVPSNVIEGNRDVETFTENDWINSFGYDNREMIYGSRFNRTFIKNGITFIFVSAYYSSSKDQAVYIRDSLLESDTKVTFIFTHAGSRSYEHINDAVDNLRLSGDEDMKVYHIFGHHHPLVSEMGEHKEELFNRYGLQYPDSNTKGFLMYGLQDYETAKYAVVNVDEDGELTYETIEKHFPHNENMVLGGSELFKPKDLTSNVTIDTIGDFIIGETYTISLFYEITIPSDEKIEFLLLYYGSRVGLIPLENSIKGYVSYNFLNEVLNENKVRLYMGLGGSDSTLREGYFRDVKIIKAY